MPESIPENNAYDVARSRRVRLMEYISGPSGFPYNDEVGVVLVDLWSSRGVRSVVMPASSTGVVDLVREGAEHVSDREGAAEVICDSLRDNA